MAKNFIAVLVCVLIMKVTKGMSSVELTSTLFDGEVAYDGQQVTFTCIARSREDFLTWDSAHYIDQPLQISYYDPPGHRESSLQNPSTVATLINATTNGRVVVIISQLQITASLQNPISNVSCQIDNLGSVNSIQFRVLPPTVQLVSTLLHRVDENLALEMQQVNFTCIIISHEDFLTWSGTHCIDQPLQISFHDPPGHQESSPQNSSTVATLVNATTNGGVMVIVSQLQITASLQNPICTISCRIDNNGPVDTIQFQTVLELPATTPEPTTSGISDGTPTATDPRYETGENDSASSVVAAGIIAAIVGGGVVVIIVICVAVIRSNQTVNRT